jgi:hypothetical protein
MDGEVRTRGCVVYCTARSGSSLLVGLLRNRYPQLMDLDEYFYTNLLRDSEVKNNDWLNFTAENTSPASRFYLKSYRIERGRGEDSTRILRCFRLLPRPTCQQLEMLRCSSPSTSLRR